MRTAAAVTALVLTWGAAGCSPGEAEPVTLPPVASESAGASGSPGVSGSPSLTASPGEVEPSAPPSTPASGGAAAASASAFARHFLEVVNRAYLDRRSDPVQELSSPNCGSCAAVIKDIDRLAAAGHQVSGRRYVLGAAEAAPALPDGRVVVDFRFSTDPYVERNARDEVVQQFPAEPARDGQMLVSPEEDAWVVTAIRIV